jgi:hypothetical protein
MPHTKEMTCELCSGRKYKTTSRLEMSVHLQRVHRMTSSKANQEIGKAL